MPMFDVFLNPTPQPGEVAVGRTEVLNGAGVAVAVFKKTNGDYLTISAPLASIAPMLEPYMKKGYTLEGWSGLRCPASAATPECRLVPVAQ